MRQRLEVFYRRLADAPATSNPQDALSLIERVIDEVEDELCVVQKKDPPPPINMPDGRMYAPLPDFVECLENGHWRALTRGQVIELSASGGITIRNRATGLIEFQR